MVRIMVLDHLNPPASFEQRQFFPLLRAISS